MRARHEGERVCMLPCMCMCLYVSACMRCVPLHACAVCVVEYVRSSEKNNGEEKEEKKGKVTERKREKVKAGICTDLHAN